MSREYKKNKKREETIQKRTEMRERTEEDIIQYRRDQRKENRDAREERRQEKRRREKRREKAEERR